MKIENVKKYTAFKKTLYTLYFPEALTKVMEFYKIKVQQLADGSLKDYDTIVSYRNGHLSPTKESLVQICIGFKDKVPLDIKYLLLNKAGYNMLNQYEDIVYSIFLEHSSALNILECNEIINELDNDSLYEIEKIKLFKTVSI